MGSLDHMVTWYPRIRTSSGPVSVACQKLFFFFFMVYNSLLKIAWLSYRNLGLCIIIFLLEFAINSILHPSPQQILPMPYGLSGHITQTAGQPHWSLDLCRAFFCSGPYLLMEALKLLCPFSFAPWEKEAKPSYLPDNKYMESGSLQGKESLLS